MMKRVVLSSPFFLCLALAMGGGCKSGADDAPPPETLVANPRAEFVAKARNVILFIGDGMGAEHRRAARWLRAGQEGVLAMDDMPVTGAARTSSANRLVTDSAAAATAMATGVKTNNGVIGLTPGLGFAQNIVETAKGLGKTVGVISTTQLAHATPAGFVAHVGHRDQMIEIATQMFAAGVDVLMGGGEDEFLPTSATGCYPQAGERGDGRNLIQEAQAVGYAYVCDAAALAGVDTASTYKLLGLFADEVMARPASPSLAQMTQTAIDILSSSPNGFFLMVEGGMIDKASHGNDAATAMQDTLEFDDAVAVAKAYAAGAPDTLIIVTGDHETGGMSVALSATGEFRGDGPFLMPDGTPFYVNWSSSEHTPSDVPVTAQGPSAEALQGTYENTYIHNVMVNTLQ